MTDLYDQLPDDAEEFVVAWLKPLGRVSIERPTGDQLPFRQVTRVAGDEDEMQDWDNPVVSVHTFAATKQACKDATRETHARMLYLVRHLDTNVTLPSGRIVNCQYMTTFLAPTWADYGDERIFRKVARYQFGLSFVPA